MKSLKFFSSIFFVAFLVMGMCFDVGPAHDLLVRPCDAEPYGSMTLQEILAAERERCNSEGGRYYDGQCNKDQNDVYIMASPNSGSSSGSDGGRSSQGGGGGAQQEYRTHVQKCSSCGQMIPSNKVHYCPNYAEGWQPPHSYYENSYYDEDEDDD